MKDAKGHGSDARGSYMAARNAELQASGPRPVIAGKPQYGMVSAGESKVASIAAAHGVPTAQLSRRGGQYRVQSLNTKLAGNVWGTSKRYGNKTVAERVAQHMRADGGYTRVR